MTSTVIATHRDGEERGKRERRGEEGRRGREGEERISIQLLYSTLLLQSTPLITDTHGTVLTAVSILNSGAIAGIYFSQISAIYFYRDLVAVRIIGVFVIARCPEG